MRGRDRRGGAGEVVGRVVVVERRNGGRRNSWQTLVVVEDIREVVR